MNHKAASLHRHPPLHRRLDELDYWVSIMPDEVTGRARLTSALAAVVAPNAHDGADRGGG